MSTRTQSPLDLPPDPTKQRQQRRLATLLVGIGLLCVLGGAVIYGGRFVIDWLGERLDRGGTSRPAESGTTAVELTIAVSPAMKPAFDKLVATFNDAPPAGALPILTLELSPDKMVEESLQAAPAFQALAPDSSLWFHELEQRWAAAVGESEGAQ